MASLSRTVDGRYHINVFWSDEDRCWIADAPDLRYCSAHGRTAAQAVAGLEVAMAAWLEAARERGLPIPEPRYRPRPAGQDRGRRHPRVAQAVKAVWQPVGVDDPVQTVGAGRWEPGRFDAVARASSMAAARRRPR